SELLEAVVEKGALVGPPADDVTKLRAVNGCAALALRGRLEDVQHGVLRTPRGDAVGDVLAVVGGRIVVERIGRPARGRKLLRINQQSLFCGKAVAQVELADVGLGGELLVE